MAARRHWHQQPTRPCFLTCVGAEQCGMSQSAQIVLRSVEFADSRVVSCRVGSKRKCVLRCSFCVPRGQNLVPAMVKCRK